MYVTTKRARLHYGVSSDTLRRWANAGKIKTKRTDGQHRRYFVEDSEIENPKPDKKSFIYARVSSSKQKSDLQNQIKFLQDRFPNHSVVSDIGSGINFKRKGFKGILEQLFDGNVEEVVVATKDRLARFSFQLLKFIFNKFNAKLIVVDNDKEKQFNEELTDDLMSVITVFSARYYGKRKYINKSNGKKLPKGNKKEKILAKRV